MPRGHEEDTKLVYVEAASLARLNASPAKGSKKAGDTRLLEFEGFCYALNRVGTVLLLMVCAVLLLMVCADSSSQVWE